MLLILETITWKPHIETAIEIALEARLRGTDVAYANLRHGLPACEDRSHWHSLIDLPEIRVRRGAELLRRAGVRFQRPPYPPGARRRALASADRLLAGCRDVDDLKRVGYEGFHDLGWAAISSVVSLRRNPDISLDADGAALRRFLAAGRMVYDATRELIERLRPDQVMLFNGRFATTRAQLRAAQSLGVDWRIHERGGSRERYWISDCLPHDLDGIQELIKREWQPQHAKAGHAFFEARRKRIERDWHSYTTGQTYGMLPEEMRDDSRWAVFFTSSEDEMVAIGEAFAGNRYRTQLDAIRALAEAAAKVPRLRVCVRVHPHVAKKDPAELRKWLALDVPGVLVVRPDAAADTYAMIDRAHVVCCYGSTVGVEATYWGRPSLLFSRSFYDKLDVCTQAEGENQIAGFLRDPEQRPREATLPYGAFWERLGQPYIHYNSDGLHRGAIQGVYLDDAPSVRLARRLIVLAARIRGR